MQNAPREHSAILSTFIKLPFIFKAFVLSIFEWPLKTGFTVQCKAYLVYFSALFKAGGWCFGLIILNLIVPCILGKESTMDGAEESYMDLWVVRLAVNLLGYATIFVPGWLLIRYLRKARYDETAGRPFKILGEYGSSFIFSI